MDRIRYLSSWSQITLLVTDEQGNAKAYTLWNGQQEPAPRFIYMPQANPKPSAPKLSRYKPQASTKNITIQL